MNILMKAVSDLFYNIPVPILTEAFRDTERHWKQMPISLEERILNKLIRPKVLVDINIVGGDMANISLEGLNPEFVDAYTNIYHIPKDRTQGRTIISALSVSYMPMASVHNTMMSGYGSFAPNSMNAINNAAQRVGDALSSIPPISNSHVELIAENTILMRDQYRVSNAYFVRCIIGNEENLNNINIRAALAFGKLCELATKAYVYNTLAIRIDQAYLQGGQELGAFKNIVESYSDAYEMYNTYLLEDWRRVAFMNDVHSYRRFIGLQFNTGI